MPRKYLSGGENSLSMEYPWRFYEKSVGMWVVESNRGVHSFPLETAGLDLESVSREYFHYFDEARAALGELFSPAAVEYPPGETLAESPTPLDLYQAKLQLFEAWREDIKHCERWAPGTIFRGLSEVSVQAEGKVVSARLPGIISAMFSGVPGSDRYAFALSTNCDIWLEKTISGEPNPVGRANALQLEKALSKLEEALDGRIVRYASEFEGVKLSEHGFV